MKKQDYQKYSYLFFGFGIVFIIFLINSLSGELNTSNFISAALFGFLIIQLFRAAFLMRRKGQELDLA